VQGLIVGGLLAAVTLSAAPTAWFGFDTAQSTTTFWLRQVGAAFAVAAGGGLGYALIFMTAEVSRAARSPRTRCCGTSGRKRRRRRARYWDARSAATCSCRSSSRSSRLSTTRPIAGSDGGNPPKC
jgi:hypothetical protein